MQMTRASKFFENTLYAIALAASISLFLYAVLLGVEKFETGVDVKVFCRAGEAMAENKNPYLTSNLRTEYSWNYPSIMAEGFHAACTHLGLMQNYALYFLAAFLLGLLPWLVRRGWLYGLTLCVTGLFNIGWVVVSGNISTLEFVLFSLSAFLLLVKNKPGASAFFLGMMSGIKLIPILYMPALVFLQDGARNKLKALIWSAAGLAFIPLLSLITSPKMFPWYVRQVLGLIPNQHTPLNELAATPANPSLSIMIFSMLGFDPSIHVGAHLILSLVIYLLGVLSFLAVIRSIPPSEKNSTVLFSFGILLLTLALLRLKPYGFLPYLLCFYLLSKDQNNLLKTLYLLLLSVLPTLAHVIYFHSGNIAGSLTSNLLQTILTFNQILFACIAVGFLLFNTLRRPNHAPINEDPDN